MTKPCPHCGQPMPEPNEGEMQQAQARLAALDALEPSCDWGNVAPGYKAHEARERWKRIMEIQGVFEAKYF